MLEKNHRLVRAGMAQTQTSLDQQSVGLTRRL
jgi:hypothetical protein